MINYFFLFIFSYIISRFLYDNFTTIANRVLRHFGYFFNYRCDGNVWLMKGNYKVYKELFIVWPKWLSF
jgi:hypothetical protein